MMRTEIQIRNLYKQYIYRYALASLDGETEKKNIFFGASIALGRTLEKDGKTINKDYLLACAFIERLREEGKELPGFREV